MGLFNAITAGVQQGSAIAGNFGLDVPRVFETAIPKAGGIVKSLNVNTAGEQAIESLRLDSTLNRDSPSPISDGNSRYVQDTKVALAKSEQGSFLTKIPSVGGSMGGNKMYIVLGVIAVVGFYIYSRSK